MTEKLALMAIFAHPDDEAFGTGGCLIKYAQEGVETHLVMATLGQVGQIQNSTVTTNGPISLLREQELRCACKHYNLSQLHLLGYMDGQTTIAPQAEAVHKIVKLIREVKPQVVVSFGPDGIYGHYDHLAVHRWATAAVMLAGDAERWPDAGPPFQVAKFYHRARPEMDVQRMKQELGASHIMMDGVPFPFIGYPIEQISTIVDISDHAETKLNAIRCHASQFSSEAPFFQTDFDWTQNPSLGQETFILAHHRPDIKVKWTATEKEDDLFAGLR